MDKERQKNAMMSLRLKQSKTERQADREREKNAMMSLRGKQSKTKSLYCLFVF